jgi:hypothetical protein
MQDFRLFRIQGSVFLVGLHYSKMTSKTVSLLFFVTLFLYIQENWKAIYYLCDKGLYGLDFVVEGIPILELRTYHNDILTKVYMD